MTARAEGPLPAPRALKRAARVAMEDVLGTKEGERVLIVTNPSTDVFLISSALYTSAVELGGRATLIVQPVRSQLDMAHDEVLGALRTDPDVIISVSAEKLGKDRLAMKDPLVVGERKYDHYFNYLLGEKKSRSFWSPSVTVDMFERTVPLDYALLKEECMKVSRVLDRGDDAVITSPAGADLEIGMKGRKARSDDGDFSVPGAGGNLPAGEVFISPELNASKGKLVYDGSIASDKGIILIDKPISCAVEGGYVRSITGGKEARKLRETIVRAQATTRRFVSEGKLPTGELDHYLANSSNLGELGIGLNRKARIVGNMLEDEKVYGTCHVAIGSNYDNDAKAMIHLDGLIKAPTITVLGQGHEETIMRDGALLL